MSFYSGRCHGGPLDGKDLTHSERRYTVALESPRPTTPDIRTAGVYVHESGLASHPLVGPHCRARWRWIGPTVDESDFWTFPLTGYVEQVTCEVLVPAVEDVE